MIRASRMNAEEREWIYNELEAYKQEKKEDFKIDEIIDLIIKGFRDKFGDYRQSVINAKKIKEINSAGPLSRAAKAKGMTPMTMEEMAMARSEGLNRSNKRSMDSMLQDDQKSSDSSDIFVQNEVSDDLKGPEGDSAATKTARSRSYGRPGRNNPSLLPAGNRSVNQSIVNHYKGLTQKLGVLCATIDELNRRNDYKRPRFDPHPVSEEEFAQANANVNAAVENLCQAIVHRYQLHPYLDDEDLTTGYLVTGKDYLNREVYVSHNLSNEGSSILNLVADAIFSGPLSQSSS